MPKAEGWGIGPDDVQMVAGTVQKLGRYAEGLFDHHEFGFPVSAIKGHIERVIDDVQGLHWAGSHVVNLRPPNRPQELVWGEDGESWNYGQSLRFAAGATMITERWRERFSRDNFRRAFVAKVLYECLAGVLDDVVDTGRYSFLEARDLYRSCLTSTIESEFNTHGFRKDLALLVKPDQRNLLDVIVNITTAFNALLAESPNGPDLFSEIARVNQRVVLGQALTMLQKENTLHLPTLKRICSTFSAGDSDIAWHERLAAYVSHVTNHSLIDMCFLDEPIPKSELDATLKVWHYYDIVIVHLNNVVGIRQDLVSGLCNLALISMREDEVLGLTSLRGYDPKLTNEDYEQQLSRTAEICRRGILAADNALDDETLFFPFISVMIPIFLMADWIGSRDDLIHAYLQALSPAIRQSVRSQSYQPARLEALPPVRPV